MKRPAVGHVRWFLAATAAMVASSASTLSQVPNHAAQSADDRIDCDSVTPPAGMVCIPAGPAIIGSNKHNSNERPQHQVHVSAFFIDLKEVTNREYRECERHGPCPRREDLPRSYRRFLADDLPAVPITWGMANRYCVWAGKRLPTEAEWEKAARGGEKGHTYPWGEAPPSCDRAIYKSCRPRRTQPVGERPPFAYGVHDMAGNGFEWVSDWASGCYDGCRKACGQACFGTDPQGPCDGAPECKGHTQRVLKGGSWYWPKDQLRGSFRRAQRPSSGLHRLSFRCASNTSRLTREPFWHRQKRPEPSDPQPPSETELAVFRDVRDDTDVLKIKPCGEIGSASHTCRDPMSYIKSNEAFRGTFLPYIENLGGGYVGIGADQAYDFIAAAKSRWAWLFDYDPTVVRIHLLIRAVALHAETPRAFADAFRLRNLDITFHWVQSSLSHRPKQAKAALRTLRELRGQLLWHYEHSRTPLKRFPNFGWLADKRRYDYIRTMFAQGRILIRKGNLLTNVVMPDIAESARLLNVPIRVYYDSNAAHQWPLSRQYRQNIIGLPMDDRSVALRTLSGFRDGTDGTKWLYVVHGGPHFQRHLQRKKPELITDSLTERHATRDAYLRIIGLPQSEGAAAMVSRRSLSGGRRNIRRR